MDEKPKNIWKTSLKGWQALLLSSALAFAAVMAIGWLARADAGLTLGMAGILIVVSWVVACGFCLFRWLFRWCNLKRSLFGLACFATLITLAYAEEDWRGWHAWNQFKRQWEAKGEKFDFKDFVPPPVPDDQNFAMAPVVASCYAAELDKNGNRVRPYDTNVVNRLAFDLGDSSLKTNPMGDWAKATMSNLKLWQDLYRELAKTNLFPVPPRPQSPAADVLLALSKYNPTVEELRQASLLPQCRFPLNYDADNPAAILLPPLASMKRSSKLLQLRAVAELQNGESDKALADLVLMVRLTEANRTEPFLISHLVRIIMWQFTLQPVYEGLAERRWTDEQLAALDAELAKLDFLADYKFSMRGELGLQNGIIGYLRRHPEEISDFFGMVADGDDDQNNANPPLPLKLIPHLVPSSFFYQNELRHARMMVEFYIPLADVNERTISPSAVRHADEVLRADIKRTTPYNILERIMLPAIGTLAGKFAYAQSSVDLARTAIALERYRLAHGEYPESLDALAPQFIAKLPHDIIGGGPLNYRRTSDGQFVLYSVGWNEKDDGGVVVFKKGSSGEVDINEGDWVWRYPKQE